MLQKKTYLLVFLAICFTFVGYCSRVHEFEEEGSYPEVPHGRHSILRDSLRMNEAENPTEKSDFLTFSSSFSSIVVSEIGDKTFFIAAMMAMKYGKLWVFVGSYGAMIIMTVISTIFGWVLLKLLSPTITMAGACVLFLIFGIKLLRDAYAGDQGEEAENPEEEAEKELEMVEKKLKDIFYTPKEGSPENKTDQHLLENANKGQARRKKKAGLNWVIVWQAFTMTFIAEWGDRSQITTFSLAVSKSPVWVCIGACLGHLITTGGAVIGGSLISKHITEKTVCLAGGFLFLLFAFWFAYELYCDLTVEQV